MAARASTPGSGISSDEENPARNFRSRGVARRHRVPRTPLQRTGQTTSASRARQARPPQSRAHAIAGAIRRTTAGHHHSALARPRWMERCATSICRLSCSIRRRRPRASCSTGPTPSARSAACRRDRNSERLVCKLHITGSRREHKALRVSHVTVIHGVFVPVTSRNRALGIDRGDKSAFVWYSRSRSRNMEFRHSSHCGAHKGK